jgi:hypothetical protein
MKWTKETALPIIQEAYKNKKLAAQNGATTCRYRGAQGPCVIGLLIDDTTAEAWDRSFWATSQNLKGLMQDTPEARDLFGDDSNENGRWFIELQQAHDKWVNANRDDTAALHTPEHYQRTFEQYIGV